MVGFRLLPSLFIPNLLDIDCVRLCISLSSSCCLLLDDPLALEVFGVTEKVDASLGSGASFISIRDSTSSSKFSSSFSIMLVSEVFSDGG